MAIDYQAPGVSVTEYTEASIAPLLATPDTVALIGPVKGTVTVTKNITLNGATAVELFSSADGTIASDGIISVKDLDPNSSSISSIYNTTGGYPATSYTFSNSARTIAVDATPASSVTSVTTLTSGSTDAILGSVGNLAPNTTYSISGTGIQSGTTFTTGSTVSTSVTLSKAATASSSGNYAITGPLIPDTARVAVTYKYTPTDYWTPQVYYDTPSIEAKFGNKYTSDQSAVNSPLSLAADIAFANGATSVVIQPVFRQTTSTGAKTPATNAELVTDVDSTGSSWTASLNSLRSINNIGAIVPVVGQAKEYGFGTNSVAEMTNTAVLNIFQQVQDHVVYQQTNNGEYMLGIFGEDGTDTGGTYATQTDLQSHVATLQASHGGTYNQEFVLVSPSKFTRTTPNGTVLKLGGQYVAVAIASALMSRRPSITLTRKNIIGFTSVYDVRTRSQMTTDSSKGLLVLEQKPSNVVQVRHAITTDISTIAKSELSVVRAKNRMVAGLRRTVDEQIIGQVVADNNAPLVVASAIGGVLSTMVDDGDIVSFSDVQAKFLTNNPTAIDVRFNYRPAFPINNVSIGFSVDLTTGTLNLSTNTTGVTNG